MPSNRRAILIGFIVILVLTGTGIVLTTEWGARTVSSTRASQKVSQSPVDLSQFHNTQTLAQMAATPQEQDLARDALRKADHEVDFEFTSALYRASTQNVASTPAIKAILDHIAKSEQENVQLDAEVARLTKLAASAKDNQKEAITQQLDLTKSRQELVQDEIDDAHQDLERAGGDPQRQVQRMVDEYHAAEQSSGGELDLSIVGKQAGSAQPTSSSFISRSQAWYALRTVVNGLSAAEQQAENSIATFSKTHDNLEEQLNQKKSQQSQKLDAAPQTNAAGSAAAVAPVPPSQTQDAISSYKSMTLMQKRMSGLDTRIRNEQDLATIYGQWLDSVAARRRQLLHSLLISIAVMVGIGLAVLLTTQFLEKLFVRVTSDPQKLLTMSSVAHIVTRAIGAILILLIIFGMPSQLATVIALAGAGLTVAMKDFIVGFFGWFVLMGKNGIRHGDWVEINGVSGEVVDIGLFHTVVLETGNWNDAGHPTGRRVTFMNSYAIEGHYFNFSTSGQWLWDEMQLALPMDRDPYPMVAEIQKIVSKETEANARLAEKEWGAMGNARGVRPFSAGPAISVRPGSAGFDILIRYVTRANERHQQRGKLYEDFVELMRRKNMPEQAPAAASAPASS
ncbi:MAG TPA: mechanosensitive ion channel domain-containing protein [Candidatus Saccharimonadales bacterium]|jgi:small-conductance mechanosensitive channel|nr:mechanosensitive ion channel domain-containing protein [Candidatus Saccharimonadales bacterium]